MSSRRRREVAGEARGVGGGGRDQQRFVLGEHQEVAAHRPAPGEGELRQGQPSLQRRHRRGAVPAAGRPAPPMAPAGALPRRHRRWGEWRAGWPRRRPRCWIRASRKARTARRVGSRIVTPASASGSSRSKVTRRPASSASASVSRKGAPAGMVKTRGSLRFSAIVVRPRCRRSKALLRRWLPACRHAATARPCARRKDARPPAPGRTEG